MQFKLIKKRSGEDKTPRSATSAAANPLPATPQQAAAPVPERRTSIPGMKPVAPAPVPVPGPQKEEPLKAAVVPAEPTKAAAPTAAAAAAAPKAAEAKHTKKLESLQALRYITALQMVGFHYFQNTPWPLFNRANAWGNAPFTFILMLSGFVMAYGYARQGKPIDVTEFLIKRWANLYPLYLVTVIAGFLLIPQRQPQPLGLLVVLLLGLSGFIPSAFINDINTPGWTIGSLFVLYAIFPFALRMLKACSPRFRAFVLIPFFFACSIAKPVADLSVNLGAISGLARVAALASVPDFLQGINLGLLFLEHDWSKHPVVLQRLGMTLSLAALSYLFVAVDLNDLPVFFQLWRPYGMLQFLWMPAIWYAAHGKDVLSYLFELAPIVYLGNTSFGVYIAQQLLIDYKWQNDPFLLANKYPRVWEFALILTALGAIGYHCIQLPYNPYITKEGTALLRRYRASKLARGVNFLWRLSETLVGRILVVAAFIPAYVAYTNWQPCRYVDFDHKMGTQRWFTMNDANWLLNWYATPCTPRRILPLPVATYVEYACLALAGLGILGAVAYAFKAAVDAIAGKGSASVAAPAADLPEDAAIVLRLVCKPTSSPANIQLTLDSLAKAAEPLKAEGRTVQVEVLGCAPSFQAPATVGSSNGIEVTALAMPFEAARSRSQIQPKDMVLTLPVGARLADGAKGLQRLLAHAAPNAAVAFPLAVDGTAEALPSLGTLAELNFLAPKRRPHALVGTASLTQKLSSTATLAALEHGTAASEPSPALLKLAPSSSPSGAWAHYATPSLSSYVARRLAFTRRASMAYTGAEKAGEATRLLLEAFFHLGFVLAAVLIIGTPVSLSYTPGNYCNFYWSNQCTNGVNAGTSLARLIATAIAAVYTGGYFFHFLGAFKASEGFVRSTILTFLLLFFLPATAAVDAYACLKAHTMLIGPARKRPASKSDAGAPGTGAAALASPSAVA